jgi:nucleoid-associated protein YgaU
MPRASDRLDLIAARTLGDPLLFWRIADANLALDPFDLVEPGRALTVPLLRPSGTSGS